MPEADPWDFESTRDKLDIFVSSRIQECADERTVARNAITSLNHNPVLFEHLGARSIKPRNLYLSRLRDSHVVVAIHRLGYGYIDVAGGMEISGLEDEFNYAQSRGIPTLLYVFKDSKDREPRLSGLINRVSPNVTMWHYGSPDQLHERIRDDVTAEITRYVVRPHVAREALEDSPENVLSRATKRPGRVILRTAVLATIKARMSDAPILVVVGKAGSGKTTLAAQFARETGAAFVKVGGLPPIDIFAICSQAISQPQTEPTFSTLTGAKLGFSAAWAEAENFTLVVDECDFTDELVNSINLAGGASATKRLLITSRTPVGQLATYDIPPLDLDEISAIIGETNGAQPDLTSPLEAQDFLRNRTRVAVAPSSLAREITSYLALSPAPLSADEILHLLGGQDIGISGLYDIVSTTNGVIEDTPSGFQIVHSETAAEIRTRLGPTPQRLRFYVNRLKETFHERGDFRLAYRVVSLLDDGSEAPLALPAIRQSAQVGDFQFGRQIAEKVLEESLSQERRSDALEMMLQLVYPMELLGNVTRANELLSQAAALAAELGTEEEALVSEAALASRARRTLAESDVDGLKTVREQYLSKGLIWDHARLGLELSAIYIASKAFEAAIEILRPTLAAFEEIGDEYGIDISERNLAAALAGTDDSDAEVDALAARIATRSHESVDPRRQKAWYNNILSRRYRTAGRLDDAEAVTKETIALSVELGEESLTALTYVNLGNVYRDKGDAGAAIEAYNTAGQLAQHSGRRDIEADSSRLHAGVLNDLDISSEVSSDRYGEAKQFALHAIALLEGSVYYEAIARAYVELADAENHMGDKEASALAFFRASELFPLVPDPDGYDASIIRATEYSLDVSPSLYADQLSKLFAIEQREAASLGEKFLALIEPILRSAPRQHLVRILGRHLATLESELPPLLAPVVLETVTSAVENFRAADPKAAEGLRKLYAGFVTPFLSQKSRSFDIHRKLARALCEGIEGLDVRYTEHGDHVWTVVINREVPIVLTIMAMDDTAATAAASQGLAIFLKVFEHEISDMIGVTDTLEVSVQVANFASMPEDIRKLSIKTFDLERILEEQSSATTRTVDFSGNVPTMAFLHTDFLQRTTAGEGVSGSLQSFLALTLVELLFLFFKGEVDHEVIRPKILSIVRETIS